MKYIILLIGIFFIITDGKSQNDTNLLLELEKELFPATTEQVYLYKYVDCERHKIDSTQLIRAIQPNPDKVFDLLEKIMYSKRFENIEKLKSIYDRHIDNFMREWAKAFKDNYYACDLILDQYSILAAFETVLTSLTFVKEKYSSKEIFDYYVEQGMFYKKLLHNISSRCELMKSYKADFSPKYRSLNPCSIYKGNLPFLYIDPFFEELKPHFVDYLLTCDFSNVPSDSVPSNCRLASERRKYYFRIKDKRIINYFLTNFDDWKNKHLSNVIYTYAGRQYDKQLSEFLAIKWVNEKDSLYLKTLLRGIYMDNFLYERRNLPPVIEEILKLANSEYEKAIELFQYLPKKETIEYLENKIKSIDKTIKDINIFTKYSKYSIYKKQKR